MNKVIAMAVVSIFLLTGIGFASDTISKDVYSYGIKNDTSDMKVSVISTSVIRPNIDKLIGYSITPIRKAGTPELFIGLFDGATNSLSGEVFAENETANPYGMSELWPFGKYIFEGVVVSQGAYTQVQVYFIKE